jgi:hypothetical protein
MAKESFSVAWRGEGTDACSRRDLGFPLRELREMRRRRKGETKGEDEGEEVCCVYDVTNIS